MDNEAIYEKKADLFQDVIDRQVSVETAAFAKQMSAKRSEAAKAQSERGFKEKLAAVRAQKFAAELRFKKEMSRCEFETIKAVREHRRDIVDKFFDEIREELVAFTKSDKYEDFLKRALSKAEKELGGGFVVLSAEKDAEKLRGLTKHEVRVDRTITLGGIAALDEEKGLYADHTLDSGLADEKQAFTDKKELML